MQTPKTRNGSSETIPQKASPAGTPRSSGATSARGSNEKNPKISRSPRNSPAKEKKRPSKIAELEAQLSSVKEELKKTKEDLTSSETCHTKAAQEAQQQILALTASLDDSKRQLAVYSAAEKSHLQEFEQISKEKSKIWETELEALQKQHSSDLTEIQILKQQLETMTESEKTQTKLYEETKTELESLKKEIESQAETVNSLKIQISEIEKNEIETKKESEERHQEAEIAKIAIEKLQENICSKEAELEASSEKIKSLEEIVNKLKENQTQNVLQVETMNEWEEKAYELELEIQTKNAELDKLKKLLEEEDKPVTELKGVLMDKETELQNLLDENETLKNEISKREKASVEKYENVLAELEIAKAAEQDVKMRLSYVTEEADKSSRRAARVAEQLDAVQVVNSEMESELKRLRVQSDQWRKAAEAAAAALAGGNNNNGRLMERSGSLDADYNSIAGKMMNSPFSDDLEFESPKKKSGSVLRRMSGLWKKSPK